MANVTRVTKSSFGGWKEHETGEYVVLKRDDFRELEMDRERGNGYVVEYKELVGKYNSLVADYKRLKAGNETLLKTIEDMKAAATENAVTAELKNKNMARIIKERANQRNGIPKREGNGYALVSMQQFAYRFHRGTFPAWKYVIVTPYELTTTSYDVVVNLIKSDGILNYLGIEAVWEDYTEYQSKSENYDKFHPNHAMEMRFSAMRNVWQFEFMTFNPLDVPEQMISRKPEKKNTEKKVDKPSKRSKKQVQEGFMESMKSALLDMDEEDDIFF